MVSIETPLKRQAGKITRVKARFCAAFVLKVRWQEEGLQFILHDLRTGKTLAFASWKALEDHIQKDSCRGLR